MHIEYPNASFIRISCAANGTAGTGDIVLEVSFRCEGVTAEANPYLERVELEAFISELGVLLDGKRTDASASSDSASHSLLVQTLDLLGHYVLRVGLSFPRAYRGKNFVCSCTGVFELEFSQLAAFHSELNRALGADV